VKRKTYVLSLCGGLGNQLFQLANALAVTNEQITVESNLGHPRLNQSGVPEIMSFSLSKRVILGTFRKPPLLLSKTASYLLRTRSLPKTFEKFLIFRFVVTLIANFLFSLYFNRICILTKSTGLGVKTVRKSTHHNFQIGYFQSFLTTANPEVFEEMKSISVRDLSEHAIKILNQAQGKRILIIHIRLTDYLAEANFGILSSSYYSKAVSFALEQRSFSDVWIFSDEVELAKQRVHLEVDLPITWFSDLDLSTAETFTVMRNGQGFIIANSSFSWWAARLSTADDPLVIAPKPWFKSLDEPDNLIPLDWVRIDANYG
jgi:hypothetical protein